jgi:hypothetical protein
MNDFEWGHDALGANTPEELQRRGLNVYFAPNVPPNAKVVNLANGRVAWFQAQQRPPTGGYFADFDSLLRYCERNGAGLLETDGLAVVQGAIRPAPVALTVEDVPNTGSPDGGPTGRTRDLRGFPTAYEAREFLPELAASFGDDHLRQIRIWKSPRFEANRMYFDLDNPERGPFVATGDEGFITDHTYVCRDEVMEDVWAQLVAWRQPANR